MNDFEERYVMKDDLSRIEVTILRLSGFEVCNDY